MWAKGQVVWCRLCNDERSLFYFVKQKTAYELRISDWSSDVCSSDLSCASGPSIVFSSHDRSPKRAREGKYDAYCARRCNDCRFVRPDDWPVQQPRGSRGDRKSTRLNSSH